MGGLLDNRKPRRTYGIDNGASEISEHAPIHSGIIASAMESRMYGEDQV